MNSENKKEILEREREREKENEYNEKWWSSSRDSITKHNIERLEGEPKVLQNF